MLKISESVSSVIKRRMAVTEGPYSDNHHLALVVEGGGMRGVAAGGMVSALEKLGLTKIFDSVHGTSAGAAAAAYFAVGRAALGTSLYYEDLNDGRFINKWRAFRGGPILDSSFLVDEAMVHLKPFDFIKLQTQRAPKLHIIATDIDAGVSFDVSAFPSYDFYRQVLRASVSLPLIAGNEIRICGRRLLDGGLLQQIALQSAEAAGATHIVALMTRGEHELRRPLPSLKTQLEAFVLQRMYGGKTGELYYNRANTINDQIEQIIAGTTRLGVPIASVGLPSGMDYVHRLTTDATLLKRAAEESFEYTMSGLKLSLA